jgi:two-component system, response regulator
MAGISLAFEKAGISDELVHVWDAEEARKYLVGETPFSDRNQHRFPDLLLLDLRMPGVNGFDLLRRLQSHPELSALPVTVLSNSALEPDIQKARSLARANS